MTRLPVLRFVVWLAMGRPLALAYSVFRAMFDAELEWPRDDIETAYLNREFKRVEAAGGFDWLRDAMLQLQDER